MNAGGERMDGIYTSRLRLRLPVAADAVALSRLMAPRISARLASWPPALVDEAAQLRIEQTLSAQAAGRCLPMVVTRRSDEVAMGWISASLAEGDARRAILTYWIGEEFQGQGIMREAALPALEEVFRVLAVHEVRAAVQSDNAASRAVLMGMGMHLLGPGRIWCSARAREETCEWWAVQRSAARDQALSTLAFAGAPLPASAVASLS
jgi:RimJ/RimL family protein N-acetyltransferase